MKVKVVDEMVRKKKETERKERRRKESKKKKKKRITMKRDESVEESVQMIGSVHRYLFKKQSTAGHRYTGTLNHHCAAFLLDLIRFTDRYRIEWIR